MKGSCLCGKVVMNYFLSLVITRKLSASRYLLWESKEMNIRSRVWTIDRLVTSHFCDGRWLLYGHQEMLCNKGRPYDILSLYVFCEWLVAVHFAAC